MTAPRRDGGRDETPFGAWLRGRTDIDSQRDRMAPTDIDFIFHRYSTHEGKGFRKRELHLMMFVEVKTFGVKPSRSQFQTICFAHQKLKPRLDKNGHRILDKVDSNSSLWCFGFYVLILAGATPQDGKKDMWGIIQPNNRDILYLPVPTVDNLAEILRFARDPNLPQKALKVRPHHTDRRIVYQEVWEPIGIFTEIKLVVQS